MSKYRCQSIGVGVSVSASSGDKQKIKSNNFAVMGVSVSKYRCQGGIGVKLSVSGGYWCQSIGVRVSVLGYRCQSILVSNKIR